MQPSRPVNTIPRQLFGILPDGRPVEIFTLVNRHGLEMKVINYGGIITSLKVPDKNGSLDNIVLGYNALGDYVKDQKYLGALIGRYANRIAHGKFELDGKQYQVERNNNGHHLHGGSDGFHKVYWDITENKSPEGPSLKLRYESDDMEEGYPGTLNVEVLYLLTDENELKVIYHATTDKKTVVNMTQHTYFNLSGKYCSTIPDHDIHIHADRFIPVDNTLIPTGELLPVKNTPFDFTTVQKIGARIDDGDEQLKYGQGYDHCWALSSRDKLKLAVEVFDQRTGRRLDVLTTEPGVQFYTGNFLDETTRGSDGMVFNKRSGFCLETQHFPDSPNQPFFPSVVLNPGDEYSSATIYRFYL